MICRICKKEYIEEAEFCSECEQKIEKRRDEYRHARGLKWLRTRLFAIKALFIMKYPIQAAFIVSAIKILIPGYIIIFLISLLFEKCKDLIK